MKYFISRTIKDSSVAALRPRVEESLKSEGFGVLTEIDIQATMKKKLNKDYLPHLILGACSPSYADQVLSIDPNVSAMLPCNVTLRELEDGGVEVAAVNPVVAMETIGNKQIEEAAHEVYNKLSKVIAQV